MQNTDKWEYCAALRGFGGQHTYAPMIGLIAEYEREEMTRRLNAFAKKTDKSGQRGRENTETAKKSGGAGHG